MTWTKEDTRDLRALVDWRGGDGLPSEGRRAVRDAAAHIEAQTTELTRLRAENEAYRAEVVRMEGEMAGMVSREGLVVAMREFARFRGHEADNCGRSIVAESDARERKRLLRQGRDAALTRDVALAMADDIAYRRLPPAPPKPMGGE